MWNDTDTPQVDDFDDVPAAVASPIAWTDGQLVRLESEWRQAQRAFAYHPSVGITALEGDPPVEYQVDYKVHTLVLNEAGELQYADSVSVHVWMPPGFPNQPPLVRPMASVFHPNIAYEGVYFSTPWQAGESLVEFIRRVGEYLAYRAYDPEAVVNQAAYQWLEENSGILPLDARADFSPTAGGEPLGRISRFGAATLDQIRKAIDEMRQALVSEGRPATAQDVQAFAEHTRSALGVFLEGDVPDELRQSASEFDDWTRELPASVPSWEYLRGQRAAVKAVHWAVAVVGDTRPLLLREMEAIERLLTSPLSSNAAEAVRQLPTAAILQEHQLKLPPLVRTAQERAESLRARVEALSAPAPNANGVREEGAVGRRLHAQMEELSHAVLEAQQAAAAAMSEFRPVLGRARAEAQALEKVVGWRGYMDTYAQGINLERRLKVWGAAGVQAYYLESEAGQYGPFQYEEALELGGTRVAVRNLLQQTIEVFDADSYASLGRDLRGSITVPLRLPDSEDDTYPQKFALSMRCDDALVQLDFIIENTAESLQRLQSSDPEAALSRSWCGQIVGVLAAPSANRAIHEEHRRSRHRWKSLVVDLTALSRFKERLATYHLIARMAENVPQLLAALQEEKKQLKESTKRSAEIAAKCGRDVENDRLVIPPKLAKPYADEMAFRKKTQHAIQHIQKRLTVVAEWTRERVGSQRLVGRPELPSLHLLPGLPEALAAMADAMSDEWMTEQVAILEELLNTPIPLKIQPAPVRRVVARPSAPSSSPPAAETHPVAQAVQSTGAEVDGRPIAEPVTEVARHQPYSEPAVDDDDELFVNDGPASAEHDHEDDDLLIFEDEPPAPSA